MQDSRSYPERFRTRRFRLITLVWLGLALTLLVTRCGGGDGGMSAPPGAGVGGSPHTTGDQGVAPPTSGSTSGRPPTSEESSLDRYEALARRELQQGSIVYNPPEQMRLDERTRIEARVTRHPDSTFTSNLQGKGASRVEQLPVGTKMRGELLSDDFTITPLRPEVQQLGAKGFRSWVWEIRPSRTGELTLTLVLSVVYDEDTLDYRSFDRSIKVSVTPSYATTSWLSRNWDKILGALGVTAVGAVGGLLAFLRRRRRTPEPEEAVARRTRPLERQRNSR
jgi:hypothetical protein